MKRDNDYLRELLFEFENADSWSIFFPQTYGMSDEAVKKYYHIQLLYDDGYLVEDNDDLYRLTSQGHDFIESIRDKGIWEETKEAVAETGGNATLEILKAVATGLLKKKLSEHADIDL